MATDTAQLTPRYFFTIARQQAETELPAAGRHVVSTDQTRPPMVEPGAVIDMDFEVTVVQDGTAETVRFGDLIFGPTLVSLYMKNNTKSCDRQVSGLVSAAADLFARGVNVLAVSKDTPRAHLNYAAKYDLSFPLVSDPTHLVAQALDAVVEKKMYGKTYLGPARSAVLVDPSGTILARIEKVDTGRHAEQVGQLLEATM